MAMLRDVANRLFERETASGARAGSIGDPASRLANVALMEDGVVSLDYQDPDHVFLVTISQVPRSHVEVLAPEFVGTVEGNVRVELVGVDLTNFVEVICSAQADEVAADIMQGYEANLQQWRLGVDSEAPTPPAARLMELGLRLSDDLGTSYTAASAPLGSSGSAWCARRKFRPRPPEGAKELLLNFTDASGQEQAITLQLNLATGSCGQ